MRCEEIVSAVTGVDEAELNDASGRDSVMEWDSLAHINLITALEETYEVSFTIEEIQQIKTIGDVKTLLKQKGVETPAGTA
ncbi:acyl carrier protein [Paenibacillus sp. MER TA 81-3]|uniref:acyl carrier protein n=1 Tax=Paenibacillus sp. MER TA 81-3 TaxID=2939573 RepID=UPI00203D75A0|nr:acyl carrier protein [Paenibacillus sp. MER TA 81-3]MCM3338077.1 acyl carrier protein [Paenibacillus sp. MER TA 81-3]